MEKFKITAAEGLIFNTGILQLAAVQAAARSHALTNLGDGLYEIRSAVQFKSGEVIGYDGEVGKALLQSLEPIKAKPGKDANKQAGK
jgi:hypothetical protein